MVEQASGEYCEAVSDFETQPTPSDRPAVADAGARDSSDLDAIERDLASVETALSRLDSGTYWTDEVTGEPIPEPLLESDPLLRRVTS